MQSKLISFLLCLAMTLGAGVSRAQTDPATAQELMRVSGIWQQLSSISPQVRIGMLEAIEKSGPKPSNSELARITRTIDRAFSADRLRATATTTYQTQINSKQVPALRHWFATKLGKAITAMEEAASADQTDPQAVARQGAALLSAMTPERRSLIQELVHVTRAAELLAQLSIDTAIAVHRGVLSVNPRAQGGSAAGMLRFLEAQKPQVQRSLTVLVLASSAMAYAPLPTADLAQYVTFLKSDAGRHFNDVSLKAFSSAMVEASAEFGRGLPGTQDRLNT